MSDDHSPGDARQPYADIGGPQARHAETHDVRQEALTNPTGGEPATDEFDADLDKQTPDSIRTAALDGSSGADDKALVDLLPELDRDELARLSVLAPGTPLEQGSTYLDLRDRARGPFMAIGGQEVGARDRLVAKKMTDYQIWNRLTSDRTAEIERPS